MSGRNLSQLHKDKLRKLRLGTAQDVLNRFWSKVNKEGPLPRGNKKTLGRCWIWNGAGARYGHLTVNKKTISSHRFSYEIASGKVPSGLVLDHLCRNGMCVRPSHIEAVQPFENTLRGKNIIAINSKKKRCVRGHWLRGRNLAIDRRGHRQCRSCRMIRKNGRRIT